LVLPQSHSGFKSSAAGCREEKRQQAAAVQGASQPKVQAGALQMPTSLKTFEHIFRFPTG
jgi:hypothetical protein